MMNYASWAGAGTLAHRYISLAVMLARDSQMNREIKDVLKDARRQRGIFGLRNQPVLSDGASDSESATLLKLGVEQSSKRVMVEDGRGGTMLSKSQDDLRVVEEVIPLDPVQELASLSPLEEEVRRRTWFVTFYAAWLVLVRRCALPIIAFLTRAIFSSAWGFSTNTVPLVTVNDTQTNLPLTEGDFLTLLPKPLVESSAAPGSLDFFNQSPSLEAGVLNRNTLPSQVVMGWPDFDKASRNVVLESLIRAPGVLTHTGGNLSLMSQAFGMVSRVIEVKQSARLHGIEGPFDEKCPDHIRVRFEKVEEAMDEWWDAVPADLISGTAWDSLATYEGEYSEVVPGVLLTFLMARISLRSPDVVARRIDDDAETDEIRRAWIGSPYFIRCVGDARVIAQVLRKLYMRNSEALDYMKGLVVIGVSNSSAVLLELSRELIRSGQAGMSCGLLESVKADIGYHVRSLRGVHHSVQAAGKLADGIESQSKAIFGH